MEKHNFSTERQKTLVANMIFSKKFFNIMDDDGAGGIELEELAQPLIALGLATDTGFVKRSLKVLNPQKFGQGCFEESLTLKEFSRIFRTDPISDKLMFLIKEELDRDFEKSQHRRKADNNAECVMCDQQMDILDPILEDSEFPVNVDKDVTHEDLFESMESGMERLDTKLLSEDK